MTKIGRIARCLSLLLALTLLTGCGRGKKTQTVETESGGDPNILTHLVDSRMLELGEGTAPEKITECEWDEERGELCFVAMQGEEREEGGEITVRTHRFFCRTDGDTLLSAVPVPEAEGWGYWRGCIKDGMLWYTTVWSDGTVSRYHMNRFDPEMGEAVTFDTDLGTLSADGSQPWAFAVDGEGRICLACGMEILILDEKLLLQKTVPVPSEVENVFSSADGSVWLHYYSGDAAPLNVKSGKIGDSVRMSSSAAAVPGTGDYAFYCADIGGVWGVRDAGDGSWKKVQLADYTNSGIVGNLERACAVGGDRIFAVTSQLIPRVVAGVYMNQLVVHDPLPDVDLRIVKKLVIATRDPDVSLNVKDAIRIFNASHPGYRIVIDDRSNDPPDINFPAPGGKMMLDMVTGTYKPDILLSGGVGTYVEESVKKGLYRDLTPYLEADERVKADNLFGCVKRMFDDGQGGMWGITNSVNISPTLISTREYLGEYAERGWWTPGEFLDFAESLGEGTELLAGLTRNSEASSQLLMNRAYRIFVDRDAGTCSFDSPEFVRLLRFVDGLPTEEEYRRTSPLADLDSDGFAEMRLSGRLALGKCQPDALGMSMFTLFGTKDWVMIGYPAESAGAGVDILPNDVFVITSFCEEPDLAWEFIREAFIGGEGRGAMSALRSDFRAYAEDYYGHPQIVYYGQHPTPMYMPGSSTEFTEADLEYPGTLYTAEPEDGERMEAILDGIGGSLLGQWDRSLWQIIREEVSSFLGGVGTAEDCAAKIQSRASLYLAEQH